MKTTINHIMWLLKLWNDVLKSTTICANRTVYTYRMKGHEVIVTVRDTTRPDGYSREEIYTMLKTVRQAEKDQNWKCPEP